LEQQKAEIEQREKLKGELEDKENDIAQDLRNFKHGKKVERLDKKRSRKLQEAAEEAHHDAEIDEMEEVQRRQKLEQKIRKMHLDVSRKKEELREDGENARLEHYKQSLNYGQTLEQDLRTRAARAKEFEDTRRETLQMEDRLEKGYRDLDGMFVKFEEPNARDKLEKIERNEQQLGERLERLMTDRQGKEREDGGGAELRRMDREIEEINGKMRQCVQDKEQVIHQYGKEQSLFHRILAPPPEPLPHPRPPEYTRMLVKEINKFEDDQIQKEFDADAQKREQMGRRLEFVKNEGITEPGAYVEPKWVRRHPTAYGFMRSVHPEYPVTKIYDQEGVDLGFTPDFDMIAARVGRPAFSKMKMEQFEEALWPSHEELSHAIDIEAQAADQQVRLEQQAREFKHREDIATANELEHRFCVVVGRGMDPQ
jgi:hypothetical protein